MRVPHKTFTVMHLAIEFHGVCEPGKKEVNFLLVCWQSERCAALVARTSAECIFQSLVACCRWWGSFFFSFFTTPHFSEVLHLVDVSPCSSHLPHIYGLRSCGLVSCQLYSLDPTTRRPFSSPLYSHYIQRRMVGPLYFYEPCTVWVGETTFRLSFHLGWNSLLVQPPIIKQNTQQECSKI